MSKTTATTTPPVDPQQRFPNGVTGDAGLALLGPEDPPPFRVLNAQGAAPVLLVCDHASAVIPRSLRQLGLDDEALTRHIAYDIGAAGVARALSARFDAPAVLAGFSRLVVDCNRYLYDPEAFREVSDGTVVPGNLGLSLVDKARRADAIRTPYHGAIAERLARFSARGVVPAVISIHSFTPRMNGFQRPWEIGVLWDLDGRIAGPLIRRLGDAGIVVGDNEPYSGRHPADFTIDHHAEASGLPCVSIEVRQDLVETDAGIRHWAQILGDAFDGILASPELYTVRF